MSMLKDYFDDAIKNMEVQFSCSQVENEKKQQKKKKGKGQDPSINQRKIKNQKNIIYEQMSFPVETDQDNKITYTFNHTEPDSVVLLTKDVEKFIQKYQNSVQTNFTTVDEAKRLNLMKRAMIKQNLNRQKIIKSFFEIALQLPWQEKDLVKQLFQKYRNAKFQSPNKKKLIKQYTSTGPFHRILNSILRMPLKSTEKFFISPFVKDMYLAIRKIFLQQKGQNVKNKIETDTFKCYRGTFITSNELNFYKANRGIIIESTAFLSTSRKKQIAARFCHQQKQKQIFPLLIQINVNVKQRSLLYDFGYGFINEGSLFSDQEEVLLNIFNKFQIIEVIQEEMKIALQVVTNVHVLKLNLINQKNFRKQNPIKRQKEIKQFRFQEKKLLQTMSSLQRQLYPLKYYNSEENQGNILSLEPDMREEAIKYFSFLMNLYENTQKELKIQSSQLQKIRLNLLSLYFSNMELKNAESLLEGEIKRLDQKNKSRFKKSSLIKEEEEEQENDALKKDAVYFYKCLTKIYHSQKQLQFNQKLKKQIKNYLINNKKQNENMILQICEKLQRITINIVNCLIQLKRWEHAGIQLSQGRNLIQSHSSIQAYPFSDQFQQLQKLLNRCQNEDSEIESEESHPINDKNYIKKLDKIFDSSKVSVQELQNEIFNLTQRQIKFNKKQQFLSVLYLKLMESLLQTQQIQELRKAYQNLLLLGCEISFFDEDLRIIAYQIFEKSLKDQDINKVQKIHEEISQKIQRHQNWLLILKQENTQQVFNDRKIVVKKKQRQRILEKQTKKFKQLEQDIMLGINSPFCRKQEKKKEIITKQMKKQHKKLFEQNKERIEDAQSMKKLKKTVTKLRKQKKQEDYMKQHGLNVIQADEEEEIPDIS